MIHVDISKCTGCSRCETACAFYHTGKTDRRLSRIKVMHLYDKGIDGPVVCAQCEERYCMPCPADALRIGPEGQVVVAPTVCELCGLCEERCPIGAIELADYVVVCDLCGGEPHCVEVCTEGAITYLPEEEGPSLKELKGKTKGMNSSEKRYEYIKKEGRRR
ncbi:MAG: 4Fe-4S dicluster domain-containing protein [Euryarchaeota archaeon]|nr:4Fe-4S dicluster domain-containing protein [Euryarchaeota archaeon]